MHIYTCENGQEVPSVTTILQIIGVKEIIRWANHLGFKHIDYDTELNRTADIGTKAHTCLQHVVDKSLWDEPIVFKDQIEEDYYTKLTDRFTREISKFTYETIFTEKTFTSSKLGYGGTIDWYAKMAGSLFMLHDFKTSKRVRMKHLLQLGGYYNLLQEHDLPVNGASIILANTTQCSMYPINEDQLKTLGIVFNKIFEVYLELNTTQLPPYDEKLLNTLRNE